MDVSCGAFLCKPLLNTLVFFYQTIAFQDLGVAIIFLTLGIRIVLYPVFHKSAKHQLITQKLQPEVKKIQEKHKDNREKQGTEIMALYKAHGTNPLSGIFFLIIQLPILITMYRISLHVTNPEIFTHLYSFVRTPEVFNSSFLGLINLGETSIILVGLAAGTQFLQGKLSTPKYPAHNKLTPAEKLGRHMGTIGAVIAFIVLLRFPAAVALYWLTSALFSVGQQIIINKTLKHGLEGVYKQNNSADGVHGVERRDRQ